MKKYEAFCPYCLGRVEPMDDEPHEWYVCPKHGEIETQDVEMEEVKEVDQ